MFKTLTDDLLDHCRVGRNSELIPDYSNYLCFTVTFRRNNLIYLKDYSEKQKKLHDLIQSLHDGGLGYRRISYYLNGRGIKTERGKTWSSGTVHSVLKRFRERQERIKSVRDVDYETRISKLEVKWLEN